VLDLSALRIAAMPAEPPPRPPPVAAPVGGTVEALEYIAARARRTLADPSKVRRHAQERDILTQVEHELAHRKG
jgi:hypothetical protein